MSTLIASLVPETLRRAYAEAPTPVDGLAAFGGHGAVLWCDVAKFSPLANTLVGLGPAGVERLSAILNRHFDTVLDTALAHGGDPIQFFGDGVLIAFLCAPDQLGAATARATACAAAIIEGCRPELEPGLRLSLHVNVTAGSLRILDLGGIGGERLYAAVGDALTQLGRICRDQAANEVILSPEAAGLIGAATRWPALPHGGLLLEAAPHGAAPARPAAATVPDEATTSALTAFLPPPVRHGLEIGALRWTAELRTITSAFLRLPDLDHSAPDFDARMHELSRVVQMVCRRHEGVVRCLAFDEKGAGFHLLFGVPPLAHHDDPLRAVCAAQELLAEFSGRGLACSAGITIGVAYIGIIGHDARRHYAVIGDAINVASRLSHASDAEIYCDEATMQACGARISFERLAPLRVKGQAAPLAVCTPRTRVRAVVEAAIVGRAAVLARLQRLVDAVAAGRGEACLLVGEPGMGKSVLMAAIATEAEVRGLRVLPGESSRIEQATPFQTLRLAFSRLLGLEAGGEVAARHAQLAAMFDATFAERLCLINAVLPIGLPETAWAAALLPAERVVATRRLLADLLRASARTRPILLVVEDAHWADDESLHLLADLCRESKAIAVLVGARPPASALAPLVEAGAERIEVGALDRAGSAELIATQLSARRVDDEVVGLVYGRAAGNPFFTVELTRYLHDRGDLAIDADGEVRGAPGRMLSLAALPTSVRATITNRIDAMSPAPQLTLKVESVAGNRGPLAVVQHVHPLHAAGAVVAEHLRQQSRLGLVDRAVVDAVEGYEFRHDITREVVYDLVPPEPRRSLHAEIARWYERHHAADLAAYFGRIAAHWDAAGDALRAADYLEREAIRVFSNGHAREATTIGLSALRLIGIELPEEPDAIGARIGEGLGLIQARTAAGAAEALAALPAMQDARIARQVALLLAFAPLAFQSNRVDLYALAAVTALRLTLEHGTSAEAPQACSMYSVVHAAMTGDRVGAWRWSQLALAPRQKLEGRAFAEVAFVHGWFHAHWQQPLRKSLVLALYAAEQGFAAGALMFACFNLSAHLIYLQACGRPLAEVIDTGRRHLVRNGRRVKNSAFHLVHEIQIAKAFAGLTRSPLSFSDDEVDEAGELAAILDSNLGNQIGYYLVSKLKLHCHYRDWTTALDWAARARAAQAAFTNQTAEFELVQYEGLAAAGAALEAGTALDARGSACVDEFRRWAVLCPDNFAHKAALLEGAAAAVAGRLDEALAAFDRAAAAADAQGFLQDRALALEWSAFVLERSGRDDAADAALADALRACADWGAQAKIDWLRAGAPRLARETAAAG